MSQHPNARLTPRGRETLVSRVESGAGVADVARQMGVSRQAASKRLARARRGEPMSDRSGRPRRLARLTPPEVGDRVCGARSSMPLPPIALAAETGVPAHSAALTSPGRDFPLSRTMGRPGRRMARRRVAHAPRRGPPVAADLRGGVLIDVARHGSAGLLPRRATPASPAASMERPVPSMQVPPARTRPRGAVRPWRPPAAPNARRDDAGKRLETVGRERRDGPAMRVRLRHGWSSCPPKRPPGRIVARQRTRWAPGRILC